jgi:hypothetical protein
VRFKVAKSVVSNQNLLILTYFTSHEHQKQNVTAVSVVGKTATGSKTADFCTKQIFDHVLTAS